MSGLATRSREAELMDTQSVPFEVFQQYLRQLERINIATLAYRPTVAWLVRLLSTRRMKRPLRILDVGFGNGDLLRRMALWARRRGVKLELAGVDLNPWSARAAALATPPGLGIDYRVGDVFDWPAHRAVDVVVSSLFTHHLSDGALVRFLCWMDQTAAVGWLTNDLHRHAVPYAVVKAAARVVPVHRMIRHDAPLSVARGFTKPEWEQFIAQAGLDAGRVAIEWFFPFRYTVSAIR
jgi:SAM-dependent methyltransferase